MTVPADAASADTAPVAPVARLSANVHGALWMLLATVTFSCMGAVVKSLGGRLDSFQIAFFRCLFGLLIVLPFVVRGRGAVLRTRQPGLLVLRAGLGVGAMACAFYAISHMPLAAAVAISFTKPLFVILLAVVLLGEAATRSRIVATLVGFGGVLIMARPGTGGLELAGAIAVLGALFMALTQITIKRLARTEGALTILVYFGIFSTILAAIPAFLVWRSPTPTELSLLCTIGVLGVLAQTFTIRSLAMADAAAMAPFDYTRLIFAGAFGFFLFGEVPGWWSLLGAAVIIASTMTLARLESRRV